MAMNNAIQNAAANVKMSAEKDYKKMGVNDLLSSVLDSSKMRKRFDELLGSRTPQFLSALTTLINGDSNLIKALYEAPLSVVQAALQAVTFDLPIDPCLGYSYIVPYKKSKKNPDGTWTKRTEASYVLGWKGMIQLCLRTGAYSRVPDAVDVREGELTRYDRLTGDAEFKWNEDEEAREKLPIIGYAGYFRLKNGAEKTIYMTVGQIRAHEAKHRPGENMSKGWRDDFDSMARKTVIRRLVGRYGLMSIDYRDTVDPETIKLAQSLFDENVNDDPKVFDTSFTVDDIDHSTGEVIEHA